MGLDKSSGKFVQSVFSRILSQRVTGNEPEQKGFSTVLELDKCDLGNLDLK